MGKQIRKDFLKWQSKHPNFMTPNVESILTKGENVIEVSSGRGMENETMYGVTHIKKRADGSFETVDGKPFNDRFSADKYARNLKKVI
jgi:hypothetical protein